MREVVILSSVRTAGGAFGGSLKSLSVVDLGVHAAKEAIRRSGVPAADFDEVVIGNGWQAGVGPNSARLITVGAGLPVDVPAFTVNKRCGSSIKAAALGAQAIRAGDADVVLAGGAESTTNVPYIQQGARWGNRFGHAEFLDNPLRIHVGVIHGIDQGDALVHKLGEILVAGRNQRLPAGSRRLFRQRADYVVRFDAGYLQ